MQGKKSKRGAGRPRRAAKAIANFGLYWSKDAVQWGRPRHPHQLLGCSVQRNQRSKPHIDFWQQVGIYVLYSDRFEPIYAGQGQIGKRLMRHRNSSWIGPKWAHFSWFGLCEVKVRGRGLNKPPPRSMMKMDTLLDLMEGILIAAGINAENKQGPRMHGAVEYYQVVDSD